MVKVKVMEVEVDMLDFVFIAKEVICIHRMVLCGEMLNDPALKVVNRSIVIHFIIPMIIVFTGKMASIIDIKQSKPLTHPSI